MNLLAELEALEVQLQAALVKLQEQINVIKAAGADYQLEVKVVAKP